VLLKLLFYTFNLIKHRSLISPPFPICRAS